MNIDNKSSDTYKHLWTNYLGQDIDDLYYFDKNLLIDGLIKSWDEDIFTKYLDEILLKFNNFKYDIKIENEFIYLQISNFSEILFNKGLKRNLFEQIKELTKQSGYRVFEQNFNLVNFINIDDEKIELKINKKYKSESGIPEYLYELSKKT